MTSRQRPHPISEPLTVLRAQLGDEDAFLQLHGCYHRPLLYYLRRLVADAAEDVLQDVWITVVRKIATLEDPVAFRAWLYRIARNRAVSRLRRQRITLSWEELPENARDDLSGQAEDDPGIWKAEDAAQLHRTLQQLSISHREVLTLRFVQELSYQEIADVVGCSLGTVRSRIHYAKKRLTTLFAAPAAPTRERNHR